jgi:hypothetical protein
MNNINQFNALIDGNREIIDSNQLLKKYEHIAKTIDLKSNNAIEKIDNLFYAMNYITKEVGDKFKKKHIDAMSKFKKDNNVNDLKNHMKEKEQLTEDIKDTMIIFQPIQDECIKLEKIVSRIQNKVIWFNIKKAIFTSICFIVLALILNVLIDFVLSYVELNFNINKIYIIVFSFFIQLLIIEPFILKPVRNKYNWKLIDYLKAKVLPLKEELNDLIAKYNSMLSQYEYINQYKIDSESSNAE